MEKVFQAILVQDMSRALLLAATAFVLTLISGGYWVRFLRAKKIGKQIRVEGPQSHMIKTGTPTMGGVIIVLPVVLLLYGVLLFLVFGMPLMMRDHTGAMRLSGATIPAFLAAASYAAAVAAAVIAPAGGLPAVAADVVAVLHRGAQVLFLLLALEALVPDALALVHALALVLPVHAALARLAALVLVHIALPLLVAGVVAVLVVALVQVVTVLIVGHVCAPLRARFVSPGPPVQTGEDTRALGLTVPARPASAMNVG